MIRACRSTEWSANQSLGLTLMPPALFATTLFALAGCQRSDPEPQASSAPEAAIEALPTPAPKALSAVGRADILAAVAASADEIAAGNPLPQSNLGLANRSFELTMPIACADGVTGAWGSWRLDPASRVLRVTFSRQNWAAAPLFTELANGQTFETAEGFWVERPWTRSEKCPQTVNGTGSPDTADQASAANEKTVKPVEPEPEQRLALVQYFSSDAPRTLLRARRPYAYTAKLPKDEGARPRAFQVRIAGRITGYADGQPVHCTNSAPSQPPICAVAVEFGRIVLEDATTGESLADWDN